MQNMNVNVSIPKEILLDAGLSEKMVAMKMLKLFVIDLFKHRQISSGKGGELLGVRKYDFIRMLADEGIHYFDYSMLELEEEFNVVDQWGKDNA